MAHASVGELETVKYVKHGSVLLINDIWLNVLVLVCP